MDKIKIVSLDCSLVVREDDILIDDAKTSSKAVVGVYKNYIAVFMGCNDGKESYLITKDFAQALAKALMEKSNEISD